MLCINSEKVVWKDGNIMIIKISMLVVFFAVMVSVGLYCRKQATDVNGFVLGGRSVGAWLSAFAYGGYRGTAPFVPSGTLRFCGYTKPMLAILTDNIAFVSFTSPSFSIWE